MCTHYRSSRLGRLYLFRRQVPTYRNWGGVQFLTRSHRTALSEQTGPVPRVITISFSSKTPYTVLVSGSAVPEVAVMIAVFVDMGEFCQTPLVTPAGLEPTVSAVKGQRVSLFHYGAIYPSFSFASVYFKVVYCRMLHIPYPILELCSVIVRARSS